MKNYTVGIIFVIILILCGITFSITLPVLSPPEKIYSIAEMEKLLPAKAFREVKIANDYWEGITGWKIKQVCYSNEISDIMTCVSSEGILLTFHCDFVLDTYEGVSFYRLGFNK